MKNIYYLFTVEFLDCSKLIYRICTLFPKFTIFQKSNSITMDKRLITFFLTIFTLSSLAQIDQPPSTPGEARLKSMEQRKQLQNESLVANLKFESVGPTVFSGRVTDIAVHPEDPTIFYAAYASGGLWKTENNGTSFKPVFDNEAVMTIGDIAVDWKNDVIWVGTGENNSSRSSYSGVGLYKSTDGGANWEYKGLPESHHIGRIILHPENPNILWVAVLGHLYSPNQERGIYKTTDGGTTWKKTLFVNENAGAIDLVIDPDDPNILYASTWERERRAWNFKESGAGSGIYKSADGGENWTLLNHEESGFPTGEGVGRIGIAITKSEGKTILYSILDNYERRPKEPKEDETILVKDDLRNISKDDFLKLEDDRISTYLKSNGFPKKYNTKKVKEMVRKDKIKPIDLVEYLEDANSLLFDTPVKGAEVYRSDDEGKTWQKTHEGYLDQVYNSYGYYFGMIRISPHNPDKIYIAGVPVLRSEDGGKTFKNINGDNVHVDHHALWLNPKRDKHLILGNDGGINISYDDGEKWIKCNSPSVGQFYTVTLDNEKPYNIYGGLQDNGVWVGPSTNKPNTRWHSFGKYPFSFLLGGDGMQVAIDNRNSSIVYTGFQFGNYFRINRETGDRKYITPKQDLGKRPYRWNWQTPIHLSVHNQDILYIGSNKLHRSMNKGDDFKEISDDLTTGGIKGDVAYSTLTTIHESPLKFGLIYVGSDDGLIHVSKDGGNNWKLITKGLPTKMWVTRVQASRYDEATVYASLNGYRWDEFSAFLYVSNDYGKNWKAIGINLPLEPINVVKEDPENENILYVGTDHGAYISLDKGQTFMSFVKDLPAVAVHDLVVHPRDKEIVLGTHGRSFWKADVSHVQQLNKEIMAKPIHIFAMNEIQFSTSWGSIRNQYSKAREKKIEIPFYADSAGEVTISIKTDKDLLLKKLLKPCDKGLNYIEYDLSIKNDEAEKFEKYLNETKKKDEKEIKLKKADNEKYYLYKGTYTVEIEKDGNSVKEVLKITSKKR